MLANFRASAVLGLRAQRALDGNSNWVKEEDVSIIFMAVPCFAEATWTRQGRSNRFQKDKDHRSVVVYSSSSYGNESCFVHKFKVCHF